MVEKIKCYCQKVLPLVFDDSLSYYEVVCKLTNKVNELVNTVNNLFSGAIEDYVDKHLKNFVLKGTYNAETETLILYLEKEEE